MRRLLAAILTVLLVAGPALAAPTHDDTESATAGNANTITTSHTVGGGCSNPYLLASVSFWDEASTLDTFSTTAGALTLLASEVATSANGYRLTMSGRAGTTGAQTVEADFSGNVWSVLISSSYCGVDQASSVGTAVTNAGGSTTASSTCSSAVGGLVADAVATTSDHRITSAGASQTERANVPDGAGLTDQGRSDEAGAASVVMDWTVDSAFWIAMCVPFNAAAATATRHRVIFVQ